MDHAYVKVVGLMLILVDSFTAWLEAIVVKDRSSETAKTVLRTICTSQHSKNTCQLQHS